MSEAITLQEAAERLGVHYMTVYRYVRLGLLAARKEGRTWLIASPDLERFQQGNASDASPSLSRRNVPWHDRLLNRLLAGDQSGAWKVVEVALASGATPAGVYIKIVAPAISALEDLREGGDVSLAVERQARVIVGRLVGRLGPRFDPRGRRKGTVVVVSPAGDTDGLGLSMGADILRGGGYGVVDLGPDLPPAELGVFLAETEPIEALVVGVSEPGALAAASEMISVARSHLGRGVPVILGAMVDDAHARRLGADRAAALGDLLAAVEAGREARPAVHV